MYFRRLLLSDGGASGSGHRVDPYMGIDGYPYLFQSSILASESRTKLGNILLPFCKKIMKIYINQAHDIEYDFVGSSKREERGFQDSSAASGGLLPEIVAGANGGQSLPFYGG